jgi:hypothetical protein
MTNTSIVILLVAATAHADTAAEREWHKLAEEAVNGRGAGTANGALGQFKQLHDVVTDYCGHDIKVLFDWKRFKLNDWTTATHNVEHVGPVEGFCVNNILDAIQMACRDKKVKPTFANVKTVTCHYKPDAEMQRCSKLKDEVNAGVEHKWSADGTNIDVTFTQHSTTCGDPMSSAPEWLEAHPPPHK